MDALKRSLGDDQGTAGSESQEAEEAGGWSTRNASAHLRAKRPGKRSEARTSSTESRLTAESAPVGPSLQGSELTSS